MNTVTLLLDDHSKIPLYEQLYQYFVNEIKHKSIAENERLPSKRGLASHLQISQSTVESAYAMLLQEGYIRSVPRSGYYACPLQGLCLDPQTTDIPATSEATPSPYRLQFKTNAVDVHSFPYATWTKLLKTVMLDRPELLNSGEGKGDLFLRVAIAKYLHEFRGVNCTPDQIVVGAGMEYLIMLLTQILGDKAIFALENPGYPKLESVFFNLGCPTRYLNLDSQGLDLNQLAHSDANIACITPSCQFPTGVVMPVGRRLALLQWAGEKKDRYIIEDDYNSEFHLKGKPIPAVQGLDHQHKVIYLSTFSRILAPSIRIAYMVLPRPLLVRYETCLRSYSSTVSRFEQHTLGTFIEGGYLSRHLNRMKIIYRKRRDLVLSLLKQSPLYSDMEITGENAGLQLLIRLRTHNVKDIVDKAEHHKIKVYLLKDYYFTDHPDPNTLILGYAGLDDKKIKEAIPLLFG